MRKFLVAVCALGFAVAGAVAQEDAEAPELEAEEPAAEEPAPEQPEADPDGDEDVTVDSDDPMLDPTEEPTVVPRTDEMVTVAVVAFEDNRANEGCYQGIEEGLAEYGFVDGQTMEYLYEEADDAEGIADFIAELPDAETTIVTPIGLEAAQAASSALGDRPMVFCAVADPVTTGLVDSMMRPGGSATGVSDMVPLSQQLALIREVLPSAVYLGILYNDTDESSRRLVERLEDFLPGAGFQMTSRTVSDSEQVSEAAQEVAAEAQVLYLLPDATVTQALEDVIAVAEANDRPLFVADAQLVEQGAVGSRAFDFHEIGLQTANVLARVLDGESPAGIPVDQAELTTLVINVGAAERMGVEFAPGFVARADEVID